ncbi:5-oxoprolinase subunit B family protein [Spirilliplanes yamanashiensis]|uniref:Allophanate hydrolase n=1 Tax=Spirilliplanes yamanashiensis TaxID=42233 RepID=A0A8J4DIG1_9ACTN|nr:allophanate hydrolase subunit 1 [Spirilliplanes yamanashiensis]MDP9815055.1 KipI family sensor histidine kinase inhibitor [Spirilliplanes yamanashiensis]GIJ02711.1 allophanate hydrolase [Spirilliplanes yamanashiensis]
MRIRRVGASALLVECADVEAWRAELWRRRERGELTVTEIVPGAGTVLLDGLADPTATARLLPGWAPGPATAPAPGPLVEVPAVFDGEDLGFVAGHWGVGTDAAVARLTGTELRVAFCGFAPGFAYMTGLPGDVPRLPAPRPRVPAGAVALAGEYTGIYPAASPGGWRLVGRTAVTLFDPRREPPALLAPGTRVRLVAA